MMITLLTGKIYKIEQALKRADIEVVGSSRAKRLTLRIDAVKRKAVLTLPKYCSAKKAVEFAQEHLAWIDGQLNKLPHLTFFTNGQKINLFGKEYQIEHRESAKGGAYFEKDNIIVCGKIEFLHRRVRDFIKTLAKEQLWKLSSQKAEKLGKKVKNISIKDTKSRWGSCSSYGNINYNWRIALAPQAIIDYLVAHEVAHLAHQNHSATFWACVESLCPKSKEKQIWLKDNAKEMSKYL